MAEYLVIRLSESADAPVEWVAVDDQGTRRGAAARGSLDDAAAAVGERRVIVLVPAAEVLTLAAEVPAKGAKLLAALPFALEDQVADDIEKLHFAAGERLPDGSVSAAVVTHARMREWLERLSTSGIRPVRVVPENHGLAKTPNTLSLLVADDLVIFNDGARTEFVLRGISPSEAIAAAGVLDGEDDRPGHLLVYCDAAVGDRYEKDWALLRHELDSVDVNLLPDGALPRLAVTVASGAGIDLLQGRYGEKTEIRKLLRPWRYAALLLVALVGVSGIAKAVDYYRLNAEQEALKSRFTEVYRQIRPNDTREIVDPVGTVTSLRRSQGTSALGPQVFLPSIEQLAAAIGAKEAVEINAISYRAGVVDVRLTAPDIPTIDGIVQAVNASGRFEASMQSADRVEDRVNSRIQIRESGA